MAAMLVALIVTAVASASDVAPPLLQIARLDGVTADGRIGPGEWRDATQVGIFTGPDGLPADLPLSVRIGWDDQGILLLWEIRAEPTIKRRDRDADLSRDDAVAVHLQAADASPIYRFAVNAGGSLYDARDADATWDAQWRALVLRSTGLWRVEMHIPFAAIDARPGEPLRANLVLSDARTAAPAGSWAALAAGADDALGILVPAVAGSPVTLARIDVAGDSATVQPEFAGPASLTATLFEGASEVQSQETSTAEPLGVTLPHPGLFRLRLAAVRPDGELVLQRELLLERIPPLVVSVRKRLLAAREIDLTIDGAGLSTTPGAYLISAPGAAALEVAPGPDHIGTATLGVGGCASGELPVRVIAVADGVELAAETIGLNLPPPPEWIGSPRGRQFSLTESPTPIEVAGSRIRCGDRMYDMGEQLLPVRITSGGRPLLAEPIRLRARVGGAMRDWEPATLRWLEIADTHAVATLISQSPLAEARIRMSCDYDGLMRFHVRVNPRDALPLDLVRLEIPVASEFATHLQIGDGMADDAFAGATFPGGWTGGIPRTVWLGGLDRGPARGLQWLADSASQWLLDDPSAAVGISRGRGRTTLSLTMLDRDLLPGESFETSFALQATPVQPAPDEKRDLRAATLRELPLIDGACDMALLDALRGLGVSTIVLDDLRFRPRPGGLGDAADAVLAQFAAACHAAGMRLMLVLDDDLTHDPVWDPFRDEVVASADDPRPCPGGPWADYAVEAAACAMERYGLDGIHLQGGMGGSGCDPLAARALMMRLRTVVREADPEGFLTLGVSAGAPLAARALADGLVISGLDAEGEPLDLDSFIALAGTGSAGPPVELALPHMDICAELAELMGLALLHDVALRPDAAGAALEATALTRAVQAQFDTARARWIPWWSRTPAVTAQPDGVLVSSWARNGELLAIMANRTGTNPVVELRVPARRRFDLGRRMLAVDLVTGSEVPQVGDLLRMRMEPGQTALVHLRTAH